MTTLDSRNGMDTSVMPDHDIDEISDEEGIGFAELGELFANRANTYRLLSTLYLKEIDAETLDALRHMRFPARTGNAKVDEGYREIATYLANSWTNSIEKLAVDFTRIFIGAGIDAYSAAYPYESVYTSEKRLAMQDARDEVLAIYRSEHLDPTPIREMGRIEGEDHIALELAFMGMLCERTAEALGRSDEATADRLTIVQRNFLEDHLAAWYPVFTADIRHFAKTRFYQGLATLTDGFLEQESAFLAELLDTEE